LNDNEGEVSSQLRMDVLKLHQLAMAVFNEKSRSLPAVAEKDAAPSTPARRPGGKAEGTFSGGLS
jgi:hypothetical protein